MHLIPLCTSHLTFTLTPHLHPHISPSPSHLTFTLTSHLHPHILPSPSHLTFTLTPHLHPHISPLPSHHLTFTLTSHLHPHISPSPSHLTFTLTSHLHPHNSPSPSHLTSFTQSSLQTVLITLDNRLVSTENLIMRCCSELARQQELAKTSKATCGQLCISVAYTTDSTLELNVIQAKVNTTQRWYPPPPPPQSSFDVSGYFISGPQAHLTYLCTYGSSHSLYLQSVLRRSTRPRWSRGHWSLTFARNF